MYFRDRMSAHGAMGCQIDPSMDPLSYFSFQPVLHDRIACTTVVYWPCFSRVKNIFEILAATDLFLIPTSAPQLV